MAAVLMLPAVAAGQQGPYPIFTDAHLDAIMTTLGPNVAGVRAALSAGDYATAKERAIRSREQLATTITFWRDRDREDAVGWLRAALEPPGCARHRALGRVGGRRRRGGHRGGGHRSLHRLSCGVPRAGWGRGLPVEVERPSLEAVCAAESGTVSQPG